MDRIKEVFKEEQFDEVNISWTTEEVTNPNASPEERIMMIVALPNISVKFQKNDERE
jgi:hypothetical protein